jgi:hypothetical protein
MINDLPPTGRGRDPHTASYRLFNMLKTAQSTTHQRVIYAVSAIRELRKCLDRLYKTVVAHPFGTLTPDAIHEMETELHNGTNLLDIAGTSLRGISAKTTMAQRFVREGLNILKEFPQPSLN